METVENPSDFDGTVTFGSFVLVTVDIASSIRGVTDDIAIQAAEALPRARCLAWVRSYTSELGSPLFIIVFLLVGRGLPAAPHSFAAVPIAPNASHPETGRAAVEPSRPLPWPDCYVYTMRDLQAPISRLYQTSDPGVFLDEDHRMPLILAWHEDMQATAGERLAAAIAGGYAIPTGIKIRDHGSYGSIVEDDSSASGSETSSREGSGDGSISRGPATRGTADGSTSSGRSRSVPAPIMPPLDDVDVQPEIESQRIILHVEVTNILDPSADFGTVDDFLAVVDQLAEIEADRAERAVTAHLSRAAAPKTTAWLQGISAAGQLDETHEDAPISPLLPGETPAAMVELDPAPIREDATQPHSPTRSADSGFSREHGPEPARDPIAPPPSSSPINSPPIDALSRPSSPQRPTEDPVAASLPEHAGEPLPSPEAAKDLEAGESLPRETVPPTESSKAGAGSPSPSGRWTLRALLSLVFSPLRALMARIRALF